jgi:hypothetical protein
MGKVSFDLNSPEGRIAALNALGVREYNEEMAKRASRENVIAKAAGREIVIVQSRSGSPRGIRPGPIAQSPKFRGGELEGRRMIGISALDQAGGDQALRELMSAN